MNMPPQGQFGNPQQEGDGGYPQNSQGGQWQSQPGQSFQAGPGQPQQGPSHQDGPWMNQPQKKSTTPLIVGLSLLGLGVIGAGAYAVIMMSGSDSAEPGPSTSVESSPHTTDESDAWLPLEAQDARWSSPMNEIVLYSDGSDVWAVDQQTGAEAWREDHVAAQATCSNPESLNLKQATREYWTASCITNEGDRTRHEHAIFDVHNTKVTTVDFVGDSSALVYFVDNDTYVCTDGELTRYEGMGLDNEVWSVSVGSCPAELGQIGRDLVSVSDGEPQGSFSVEDGQYPPRIQDFVDRLGSDRDVNFLPYSDGTYLLRYYYPGQSEHVLAVMNAEGEIVSDEYVGGSMVLIESDSVVITSPDGQARLINNHGQEAWVKTAEDTITCFDGVDETYLWGTDAACGEGGDFLVVDINSGEETSIDIDPNATALYRTDAGFAALDRDGGVRTTYTDSGLDQRLEIPGQDIQVSGGRVFLVDGGIVTHVLR